MTGLHWQPRRQSSIEVKTGREEKEVGKRQKVDWKKHGQSRREDSKERTGRQKRVQLVGRRKDHKSRRMLNKGENIVGFKKILASDVL